MSEIIPPAVPRPKAAELLHLIDRAERGAALPEEYGLLRDGIRVLARSAARERMASAHAHRADADRAEMAAQLADAKLAPAHLEARAARAYARGFEAGARLAPPDAAVCDPADASQPTCPENALRGP